MTPQVPTSGGLLLRLGLAAAVGAFIVFCVILPAEYRRDPTGFGRMTGLLELTTPRVAAVPEPSAANEGDVSADPNQLPEVSGGMVLNAKMNKPYPGAFHSDTVKIPIGPDGELEYKLKMKMGETLVYSWKVDRGMVYYDLHGQPLDDPKNAQRYLEVQEATSANGALTAPFDGIHGWYLLNLTGEPLVVTLNVAGYYELYGYVK
jgi:hypothetical protein